jgi:hypothetical protein
MLVESKGDLFVFHRAQLYGERSRNTAQEIQLVLVHGDGVQSLGQEVFELSNVILLRLQNLLLLGKCVQGFHDVFVLCHS